MGVVTRPCEKPKGKEAGAKGPEAWLYATLRTFRADEAVIRLCSRPQ
jgi:hypothetical protein